MWRCWPDIVEPPAKKAKRKVKEHADSEADTPKTRGHDQETEDNAAAAVVPAPAPAQSQPPKPANVSRHFLERWRVARPWLVHSAQEKKMFCHVCSAHAKGKRRGNAFVVGCTTMKLETIVFHENSQQQHLKAIFIWLAGKISAWLVKNFTYQPAWLVSEKVSFGPCFFRI